MRYRDLYRLCSLHRLAALLCSLTIINFIWPLPLWAQTPSAEELATWHRQMRQAPPAQEGCFSSTYPNTQWQQVTCGTAPLIPYRPAHGPTKNTIGGAGNDVLVQVNGLIGDAIGSFNSVTVSTETGQVHGTGPQVANTFSIQLNSNIFSAASACSGAAEPTSCRGWQQFVYSNAGTLVVQYWLLFYEAQCPSGWISDGGLDCYKNGSNSVTNIPPQNITNLANLSLSGSAVSGGMDVASFAVGTTIYSIVNPDSALDLANYWNVAEFNILGDGYSSEANFASGTSFAVRTEVANGTVVPPQCVEGTFTGETNNLNFGFPPSVTRGLYPAVWFTESSAGGSSSPCGSSVNIGTTTLATTHDFNADGHSDVTWRYLTRGEVAIWLLAGTQVVGSASLGTVATNWRLAGQRDFDGDYQSDLLWEETQGDHSIWLMNGTTFRSSIDLGNVGVQWKVIGTGDFNGDGVGDILWRNSSTGDVAIWLMSNGQLSSGVDLGVLPSAWQIVGTGDFNADGTTDLLWRNTSTGDLAIWFLQGGRFSSGVDVGTVPLAWTVVGTGDFNGDFTSDIVWRDTSGNVAIWLMSNGHFSSGNTLGQVSTDWSIAETGDFDGNGTSDLLWNTAAGDTAIWFMNGTTVSSAKALASNINQYWIVQGAGVD